jgi:solute carrier family 25 protein 33/36
MKQYLTHDLRLNNGKESSLIHLLSATSAGVATSTLTNPIWLVKTRMQLQKDDIKKPIKYDSVVSGGAVMMKRRQAHGMATMIAQQPQYKNSLDCAIKVIRQEGVGGLFRGLGASYLGTIEGSLQWILYEQLKKTAHRYRGLREDEPQGATGMVDNLVVAGTAKFFAALSTYPHEVIRTRLRQVTLTTNPITGLTTGEPVYKGIGDVLRTVMRMEGVLAFYGGLGAHLLRTVPNAAIMFFCYESVVFLCRESAPGKEGVVTVV